MLVLFIILNLKFNRFNKRFPLPNIDVEILHFAWELEFRCETYLISDLLVVINFSSFNIYDRIKLVIKVIDEVKRNSKRVESEWRLPNSSFWFLLRYLCLKVSIEFSIPKYDWFSFLNRISLVFIFVQFMNTCTILRKRWERNKFHFIINWIFLSWFKQFKRIFDLLLQKFLMESFHLFISFWYFTHWFLNYFHGSIFGILIDLWKILLLNNFHRILNHL